MIHQLTGDGISGVDWSRHSDTTGAIRAVDPFESASLASLCATMYAVELEIKDCDKKPRIKHE